MQVSSQIPDLSYTNLSDSKDEKTVISDFDFFITAALASYKMFFKGLIY